MLGKMKTKQKKTYKDSTLTHVSILAIPFYYIHLASTYNKVGTVVLIAYMVVALSRYAYPVQGESIEATVW
jgi:hypothetical protein